jgi:hypothetical protein
VNDIGTIFSLIACILAVAVPKKWLAIPIMASVHYMTMGQMLDVGGIHVFAYRLILIIACLRALLRHELRFSFKEKMDRLVVILCVTALVMGAIAGHVKTSVGSAGNILGFYIIFRSIIGSIADAKRLFLQLAFLVVPLSILMMTEKVTARNPFVTLGGVPEEVKIRQEKNRAQGPFRHPILAGTAGALLVIPLIPLFKESRVGASVGIISGCLMIAAASSSGPYMSLVLGCVSLGIYRYRKKMRTILRSILAVLCVLEVVMKDHVWFLMQRIDLVGGSTGWHRAALITQALAHLKEWWFCGTPYTRHWMPTGVSWSENHTDITNQYIFMGIEGGLPLLIVFVWVLVVAAKSGYKLALMYEEDRPSALFCWSILAMLVSQMITFMTIGFFDQIISYLCLTLALIASLYEAAKLSQATKEEPAKNSAPVSRFSFSPRPSSLKA